MDASKVASLLPSEVSYLEALAALKVLPLVRLPILSLLQLKMCCCAGFLLYQYLLYVGVPSIGIGTLEYPIRRCTVESTVTIDTMLDQSGR